VRVVAAGLLVVVLAACGAEVGGGDGEQVGPRPEVAIPPEASEYCSLVEEFYERLGALIGRSTDEADYDDKFIGFVREQQPLFDRLAEAAPPEIERAAAIQRDAFAEVARTGTTDPLGTEGALAAERTTVAYEDEVCGIVV